MSNYGDVYYGEAVDRLGRKLSISIGFIRGHWFSVLPCHYARICITEWENKDEPPLSSPSSPSSAGEGKGGEGEGICRLDTWVGGWQTTPTTLSLQCAVNNSVVGKSNLDVILSFNRILERRNASGKRNNSKYYETSGKGGIHVYVSGLFNRHLVARPVSASDNISERWWFFSPCEPQLKSISEIFGLPRVEEEDEEDEEDEQDEDEEKIKY